MCELESEPLSISEALSNPEWKNAMSSEYAALLRNNTWELVPFEQSMHVVQNRWVFRVKHKADGSVERLKARLVAKGFQQTPGLDFFETYSPVIKPSTLKVVFTLAVTYNWDIQQVDVNNAFLNGTLKETVFMRQPEGFIDNSKPNHVCLLKKALYSLRQAPRAWYDQLSNALLQWGFTNSTSDISLFIYKKVDKIILLLVYVDDILVTGNDAYLINKAISDLDKSFTLKILGSINFFLGFEASRTNSELRLTQQKYLKELLLKTNMANSTPCPTPMCPSHKLHKSDGPLLEEPTLYRSTVGSLQYLTWTRPDISFAVNKLSQYLQAPTVNHWLACKRVLWYLVGTPT